MTDDGKHDVPVEAVQEDPKSDKKSKGDSASATGQTGPEIDIEFKKLNSKEKKVLHVLDPGQDGPRLVLKIAEIADKAFSHGTKEQRNSFVRNSMRRLVRGGWVEHAKETGDGTYRVTERGRKRLVRHFAEESAKSAPQDVSVVKRKRGRPSKAEIAARLAALSASRPDENNGVPEAKTETSPVVAASSPPTQVIDPSAAVKSS